MVWFCKAIIRFECGDDEYSLYTVIGSKCHKMIHLPFKKIFLRDDAKNFYSYLLAIQKKVQHDFNKLIKLDECVIS